MNVEKIPAPICLTGNPVVYRLSGNADSVTLRITINDSVQVFLILQPAYPIGDNGVINTAGTPYFEADISDILLNYARPLSIEFHRTYEPPFVRYYAFSGGVDFKVSYRASTESAFTDIIIKESADCFGLPGGFPHELLAEGADIFETIYSNPDTSPFLLARGFTNGALRFYRSELDATTLVMVAQQGVDVEFTPRSQISFASHEYLTGIVLSDYSDYLLIRKYNAGSTSEYYYNIMVEPNPESDEQHLLRFVNSFGCHEALLCTGELQDISETADPSFYNKVQNYATVRRYQRRLQTRKYTLHTGHLTPARYQVLLDLLCSDDVALLQDGQYVPCTVSAGISLGATPRETQSVELTIEILSQSKYNMFLQSGSSALERLSYLQAESGLLITDDNSNRIEITL